MYSKCELNVTLKCNLRCTNCNRCPQLFAKEDTDIPLNKIDTFLQDIKGINTMKLLGGEPLMHKNFKEIYYKLTQALDKGIFNFLKIDHNHTQNNPITEKHPKVKWMGKSLIKKQHLPVLHNPKDLGYIIKPNPRCQAITRCGFSYDYRGYLPCSPAIAIVKMLKLEHLYRDKPQLEPWGLDELCPNCIMGMPEDWIRTHIYHLDKTPEDAKQPTETYRRALEALNG